MYRQKNKKAENDDENENDLGKKLIIMSENSDTSDSLPSEMMIHSSIKEISSGDINTKSSIYETNKDEENGEDEEEDAMDVQTILTEGDQKTNTNAYE